MSFFLSARSLIRRKIMPLPDLLDVLSGKQIESVLDVGAGTGIFLEYLDSHGHLKRGVGVEANPKFFRQIRPSIQIVGPDDAKGTFDLVVFNDVLHHVKSKEDFVKNYVSKYAKAGGYILVKDMRTSNVLCKYFNRLHDLIFAQEFISEISEDEVLRLLDDECELVSRGKRRIFLYDHYFMLLKKRMPS